MYKKGDVVEVYSLQSFFHGGFINGTKGIVKHDQQPGDSVLVAVKRNMNGKMIIDPSYEVYEQQLRLVKNSSEDDELIKELDSLIDKIEKSFKKSFKKKKC